MASQTNTPIVLSIMSFYAFLGFMMGLYGSSQLQANNSIGAFVQPSSLSFLSQIGYFFAGIGYSISALPAWLNFILALPSFALIYIALSFFRGSS